MLFQDIDWFSGQAVFGVAVSLFAILIATSYVFQQLSAQKKPWKTVPGWLPLVGNFHQMDGGSRPAMIQTLEKWANQYGTETGCFECDLLGRRMLVVCREDRAREILALRPFKVTRSTDAQEAVDSVGATGVFSAEGDQWRQEKKLVSSTLNKIHMQDYVPTLMDSAIALIKKWEANVKESPDGVVFVKQDLGHAPADTVGKVFLGRDFNFLHHPESDVSELVTQGFKAIERRFFSPIMYWRIPIIGQDLDGFGKYLRSGMAIISQVIMEFEEERATNSKTQSKTFLSKLYDAMEQEKSKLDHERIIGNVITAFAAGVDTTSLTLLAALYILATNKEMQSELRDHVADFDLEAAKLDDYYSKAPLLKSFLHEVHRYHCTPILGFQPTQDIPFCGTTLPKGTRILIFLRQVMLQKDSPAAGVPSGPDDAPPHVFSPRRYLVPVNKDSTTDNKEQQWQCVDPLTKDATDIRI
ncbi:P450 4V2 [Seminavis robusta]|uniref:P450 4V2 n=1 Tax=Seminavis robusta TaxID=568900 RepID=A0A9N8DQ58_9STRA|nr:P450 4V2 [Seminavis robusta]|eukprot:Sro292_g109720.1 P450 4V2 (470) ;mRNA; r:67545-69125